MSSTDRAQKEARLHQLQQEQLILQSKLSVIEVGLRQVANEIGQLPKELAESDESK